VIEVLTTGSSTEESLIGTSSSEVGTKLNLPLYLSFHSEIFVEACKSNRTACVRSKEAIAPSPEVLANVIGYVKASNTTAGVRFGSGLAISLDAQTLAVGSPFEMSNATGVNGDQSNSSISSAGAVYVFKRNNNTWVQEAYLKASNTGSAGAQFGTKLSISPDGNTLVTGAGGERSCATGVNGDQSNTSCSNSGAVYVFKRANGDWTQEAYLKSSHTSAMMGFGRMVKLSSDGKTLAIGAPLERSCSTGVNGDPANTGCTQAGSAYIFNETNGVWSQSAYIKPAHTTAGARFGWMLDLSSDGKTLVIGAHQEGSCSTGINGDATDTACANAGAVSVFTLTNNTWAQQAYIKASNTAGGNLFGANLILSSDAQFLAVGSTGEDSASIGIGGDQTDTSSTNSGAVYLFKRISNTWEQQAYIKASNTEDEDSFGASLAFSADDKYLAIGGDQ
jgi:trimeric autotransporter adhesin